MESVLKKKLKMLHPNQTKLQTLLNPGLSIKTNQYQIMNSTSSSVNPTMIVHFFRYRLYMSCNHYTTNSFFHFPFFECFEGSTKWLPMKKMWPKENCQSLFCGKDFFVALVALIQPHSVRFCPYHKILTTFKHHFS